MFNFLKITNDLILPKHFLYGCLAGIYNLNIKSRSLMDENLLHLCHTSFRQEGWARVEDRGLLMLGWCIELENFTNKKQHNQDLYRQATQELSIQKKGWC